MKSLRWSGDINASRLPQGLKLPPFLAKFELFPDSPATLSTFCKLVTNSSLETLKEWNLGLPPHADNFKSAVDKIPESLLSKLHLVILNVGDFVWLSRSDLLRTTVKQLALQTHCGYDTGSAEEAWSALKNYETVETVTTYDTEFTLAFLSGIPSCLKVLAIKGYEFDLKETEWPAAREILAGIPTVNVSSWNKLRVEESKFWQSCPTVDFRDLSD